MQTGEQPDIVVHCSVKATSRSGVMAKAGELVPSLPTVVCGKMTVISLLFVLHRSPQLSNSGTSSVL